MNTTDIIDALRSVQTESDRWHLAEALVDQVPSGTEGFAEIIDEARDAGVTAGLSRNTLRLYRDTAQRWPAGHRVPNVSFSAHREAMVLPTIEDAAKLLENLSTARGANKVTVASVRQTIKAMNAGTGTAASAATTTPAKVGPASFTVADLVTGAGALIAAVGPADDLDGIHAGLTKALAHVEKLRAQAARRAATAAKKAATAPARKAPAKPTTAKATTAKPTAKAPARKARGDLRGL